MSILGKGRGQRDILTLPAPTLAALEAWLALRGEDSGPLFLNCTRGKADKTRLTPQGLYDMVTRLGKRLGMKV